MHVLASISRSTFRPFRHLTDNALRTPRSTAFLRSTSSSLRFFCYGHWKNIFYPCRRLPLLKSGYFTTIFWCSVKTIANRYRHHHHHYRQPWAQLLLVSDAIVTIAAHRCLSRAAWLNSCRVTPHHCSMSSDHSR